MAIINGYQNILGSGIKIDCQIGENFEPSDIIQAIKNTPGIAYGDLSGAVQCDLSYECRTRTLICTPKRLSLRYADTQYQDDATGDPGRAVLNCLSDGLILGYPEAPEVNPFGRLKE